MHKKNVTDQTSAETELEALRTIVLGEEHRLITDTVKKDARSIVGETLAEALHDRQKSDGSIKKVLQPLIEDSVEHSVTHHSDRLVSSLYPIMGSLVRKSVTAFLADFMEKTNQLIENSLTIKGLKWRIKARQSGLSFAQYVASQTFVYRVEHVFLIHRETGLLLKSVNLDHQTKNDADLISSMLSAINDFVGDSFTTNEDGLKEELQTVSTDNFNLLIKPGPDAIVVAAISGTPPQKVDNQLQLTLEDIHRLYVSELAQFNGDNQPFENTEDSLRDCLLSEQKQQGDKQSKTLWFTWIICAFVAVLLSYHTYQWHTNHQKMNKLLKIGSESGIVVQSISVGKNNRINFEVLRDPEAIKVDEWLKKNEISSDNLNIGEYAFRSLEPEFLDKRSREVIKSFSQVDAYWQDDVLVLSGPLSEHEKVRLLRALSVVGLQEGLNMNTDQINLSPFPVIDKDRITLQVFEGIVGKLSSIQLNFDIASDEITPSMNDSLAEVFRHTNQLLALAHELSLNVGLVIIGSSDSTGSLSANNELSKKRANNTASTLTNMGLDRKILHTTGLGKIQIENIESSARKVMFNVIYTNSQERK